MVRSIRFRTEISGILSWMESALCILVSFAAVFWLVTSRNPPLWGGGLRDATRLKNGCEGDYVYPEVKKKKDYSKGSHFPNQAGYPLPLNSQGRLKNVLAAVYSKFVRV